MVTKWVFVLLLALVVFASGDAQSTPVAGTLTESTASNVDHAVWTGRGNKRMYQANVGTDGDDGEERGMAEAAAKIQLFFRSKMTVIRRFFKELWALIRFPGEISGFGKVKRMVNEGATDEELIKDGCDPTILFQALGLPKRLTNVGSTPIWELRDAHPNLQRYF